MVKEREKRDLDYVAKEEGNGAKQRPNYTRAPV